MPAEGIRRDDVLAASVLHDGAALGLAIYADYLLKPPGVIGLRKLPLPVCHGQIVYPLFDTAQCRFRCRAVSWYAHLAESVEIVPAEFYYFGAPGMPRSATEYHQYYDICQAMADVHPVGPAEIVD